MSSYFVIGDDHSNAYYSSSQKSKPKGYVGFDYFLELQLLAYAKVFNPENFSFVFLYEKKLFFHFTCLFYVMLSQYNENFNKYVNCFFFFY